MKFVETDYKEKYSKTKLPKNDDLDYLIIGAGPSGLAAGATLSKLGKKVLVLERIGKAGGGMHTFKKEEFIFDTGLHYLGNEPELKFVFNLLLARPVKWIHSKIYDTLILG